MKTSWRRCVFVQISFSSNWASLTIKKWWTGYSSAWGNYVVINHGNGITTLYAHMSKILTTKGATVSAGQQIGKVGSTGYSTGNHLHFSVRKDGAYTSPWNYLSQ